MAPNVPVLLRRESRKLLYNDDGVSVSAFAVIVCPCLGSPPRAGGSCRVVLTLPSWERPLSRPESRAMPGKGHLCDSHANEQSPSHKPLATMQDIGGPVGALVGPSIT